MPILLGQSFLHKYGASIDFYNKKLIIKDLVIPFSETEVLTPENEKETLENRKTKLPEIPKFPMILAKIEPVIPEKTELENFAEKAVKSLPSKLGKFPTVEPQILLKKDNSLLEKWTESFRFSIIENELLEKKIKTLLNQGFIKPSQSPVASPTFFVKKRLVIDYRNVNRASLHDYFPLPDVNHVLNKVRNRSMFSKIDLSAGYHQVGVKESSRYLTSFVVPCG